MVGTMNPIARLLVLYWKVQSRGAEDRYYSAEVAALIEHLLSVLNPREFALVCHFNELSGHPYKSRKAMASELGLSTTRISQIYQTALKKMQTALAEQDPSWKTLV